MRRRAILLLFPALALSATLGTPGFAQVPNVNLMPELKSKTPEEKEREEKADRAYRDSLRKIPDAKAGDPWGDMRGAQAPAPKSAVKPKPAAAKRAKIDAPAN